jgi:hypothetical protein
MKGKIYKIVCKVDENFCYFGSTIHTLNKRWSEHKSNYKLWKEWKRKNMSTHEFYDKYGIENFEIELIEELDFDNIEELKIHEQYYINNFDCVNIYIAYTGLTKTEYQAEYKAEYRKDNKEKIAEQNAKYRKENKEKISKKRSIKITCECGSIVSKRNSATHKKSNKHQAYLKSLI